MTKLADDEIMREWRRIEWKASRGRLARRIASVEAERLEARGVTEADIDRLFPDEALIAAPTPRDATEDVAQEINRCMKFAEAARISREAVGDLDSADIFWKLRNMLAQLYRSIPLHQPQTTKRASSS